MNGPVPMGAKFSAVHSGARAHAILELALLQDRQNRTDERRIRERHRHVEFDPHRVVVDCLHRADALERRRGRAAAARVQAVGRGERDVVRGERRAVGPHHVVAQRPGDRPEIPRHAAVVQGRDLGGQPGDHVAVFVVARQRLQDQRRRVDILGAARQVGIEDRRRLPVQHVQLTVGAALGRGCHRQRDHRQRRQDQSSWFCHESKGLLVIGRSGFPPASRTGVPCAVRRYGNSRSLVCSVCGFIVIGVVERRCESRSAGW